MIDGKIFVWTENIALAVCVFLGVVGFLVVLFLGERIGLNPYQTGALALGTCSVFGLSDGLHSSIRRWAYRKLLIHSALSQIRSAHRAKGE